MFPELRINPDYISNGIRNRASEIADLIYLIQNEPANVFNENIIIKRKGIVIHLFIKIGAVIIDSKISNIVISFEDITQLVVAQREAAWSDVARRIAQFNCTGDWAFYLEGDEIVHEEDLQNIVDACRKEGDRTFY